MAEHGRRRDGRCHVPRAGTRAADPFRHLSILRMSLHRSPAININNRWTKGGGTVHLSQLSHSVISHVTESSRIIRISRAIGISAPICGELGEGTAYLTRCESQPPQSKLLFQSARSGYFSYLAYPNVLVPAALPTSVPPPPGSLNPVDILAVCFWTASGPLLSSIHAHSFT